MSKQLLWGRLLVSLYLCLLLLVLNSEPVTSAEAQIAHTQTAYLLQNDVDALNAIAHSLKMREQVYSRTICMESMRQGTSATVQCKCGFENHTLCHVTYINFSGQRLRAAIPPEVANLTHLRVLDLGHNKLHGYIPYSFRNLSQLSVILLHQNNLEGPIPTFLGELKLLQHLDLSGNFFNGRIPTAFLGLPSLNLLSLSDNLLHGPIPPEFGNISSLVELDLSDNQLSGVLPQELGNLRDLQSLWLINNELTGELPPSFAELKNMLRLHIFGNNFSGRIPEFIANWKHLQVLGLTGNCFEGPFPKEFSSLINLTELHVADLIISHGDGRDGRGLPFPNISRMASLGMLTLRNCSITGPIPGYIGRMGSLYYLDLSFNKLTGEIPAFINHQKLQYIYLRGNKLNGSLSGWLTDSTNSYVDISENNFTNVPVLPGNIFKNVNSFACCSHAANPNLTWQKSDYHCYSEKPIYDHLYINCGGERTLTNGNEYEADLEPYGESVFFLSDDKSWGYSSMGTFLVTNRDQYTVARTCGISMVDASLYKTARVSPISLKYYGFCMKNDKYIVKLHFAEIFWGENRDPSSKGKRVFDVEIQGEKVLSNFNIKEAARGVNRNVTLDFITTVRDTRLEIHLYWAGKGSIRPPMEYYGPLISAISVFPVPRKSGRKLSALSITGIAGSTLLLAILILVFLWKMGWLGGKEFFLGGKELRNEELKDLELLPGGFFNFWQIKAATQNFSSLNKIGEGGFGPVYKGVLPNGTAIAVKQLSSNSKQGTREFVNELGTISALQHPHLVRLLGSCTEDDHLLLVYEYMENNSLAHALFGPEELRKRLTWRTRLKICLGIAKGLAFLHEESKLKIVHRDIKPTNVLLDKDLKAKISDFGIAKLYEGDNTHIITRIAGTTGYMAPEYAMRGYLTDKADVYSFGVVTLEIVSGKNSTSYRPNDESVYLLDMAYVLHEKGDLISLVDPILGSDYSVKQAMTILDLAMLCTNPSPTLRPTMSEVVKILEGKSKLKAPLLHAPYSTDDFARAKAMVSRIHSGSDSTGGTSNPFISDVSRDGQDCNISEDYSPEILDNTGSLTKKIS